ncbi:MAG: caspase family protein, partial [Deltaproteobacteria bacterium]
MHRLKARLVLFSISLLLFACATSNQKQKMPPFKFGGTTLSKEINKSGDLGIPIEPTTTFHADDDKVIALVRFENLAGEHNLRWEWYEPSGQLYYSTANFPFKTSRDKYLPVATAWHRLSIDGDPAANNPGQWEVKVFLDNELMDTKPFLVKVFKDAIQLPADLAQRPYPKDWGLIIGIEDYAHLPAVEYARKDALIVKDYFIKVLGVPEENVISLIDSDATKARLEGYLKEYIPSNVGKDSTLYVYFAGHGAPGMEKGEPYLIPYDGDTRFIERTGYKLVSFYQDLNNLKIQNVYVFLDSCFSGVASRAAEMLVKGARPALIHV